MSGENEESIDWTLFKRHYYGTKLDTAAASLLESKLQFDSTLGDELELLGYFYSCKTKAAVARWMVLLKSMLERHFESGVWRLVELHKNLSPRDFANLREFLKSLLIQGESVNKIINAGNLIGQRDFETGIGLLERALMLSPDCAFCAFKISTMYIFKCENSFGRTKREYFDELYSKFLRYLKLKGHRTARAWTIRSVFRQALELNELEKAHFLALRARENAKSMPALQPKAQEMIGLVALKAGDLKKARQCLNKLAKYDVGYYEMNLAMEMIEVGEYSAVADYLRRVEREAEALEYPVSSLLKRWIRLLESGNKPCLHQLNPYLE